MADLMTDTKGNNMEGQQNLLKTNDQNQQLQQGQVPVQQNQMSSQPQLGGQENTEITTGTQTKAPMSRAYSSNQKGSGLGQRLQNLRKYVESNTNSNMVNRVGQNIQQKQDVVTNKLTQSTGDVAARQQAEQQRLQQGQQTAQNLFQNQGELEKFAGINQGGQYQGFSENPQERIQQFKQLQQGQANLQQLEDAPYLQQDIQRFKDYAGQVGTESGRFQLLRDTFQRPDYTRGQQRLDQLIIQAQPEQAKSINQFKESYKPLEQKLLEDQAAIQRQNEAISSQAGSIKDLIAQQGQSAVTGLDTSIQGRVAQAQKDQQTRLNQLRQSLLGNNLSAENLQELGVKGGTSNVQDFMSQYNRLQQKSLEQKMREGIQLDANEKSIVAQKLGVNVTDIENIQRGGYSTFDDFMRAKGNEIARKEIENARVQRSRVVQQGRNSHRITESVTPYKRVYNQATQDAMNPSYGGGEGNYSDPVYTPSDIDWNETIQRNLQAQRLRDIMTQEMINANQQMQGRQQDFSALKNIAGTQKFDFAKYIRDLPSDAITKENVASVEDYNRAEALRNLLGVDTPINVAAREQAGQYKDLGAGRFNIEQALAAAREVEDYKKINKDVNVSLPELRKMLAKKYSGGKGTSGGSSGGMGSASHSGPGGSAASGKSGHSVGKM